MRSDTDAARVPSFAIARKGEAARVRFAGLPLGHEFSSLVLALLQVGGHPPRVDPAVAEQIRALPAGIDFEVVVSLSCHNCPDVVQALNLVALLNPNVTHEMVDGELYQEEVERLALQGGSKDVVAFNYAAWRRAASNRTQEKRGLLPSAKAPQIGGYVDCGRPYEVAARRQFDCILTLTRIAQRSRPPKARRLHSS